METKRFLLSYWECGSTKLLGPFSSNLRDMFLILCVLYIQINFAAIAIICRLPSLYFEFYGRYTTRSSIRSSYCWDITTANTSTTSVLSTDFKPVVKTKSNKFFNFPAVNYVKSKPNFWLRVSGRRRFLKHSFTCSSDELTRSIN